MDIAGIREALHKAPFQAFSFHLADGTCLSVPHPDFVAVHPERVIVVDKDGSWSVVDPALVVSLHYKPKRKRRSRATTKS